MNNQSWNFFDVIVVGGGHAGIEAAYASARLGARTLLVTIHLDRIGLMPCNPAIGGIGKGHIVFEISALGGLMPKLCSSTYLQARMLNTRKGPAVQGLRLQIDKISYNKLSRETLEKTPNLTIVSGMVEEVVTEQDGNKKKVVGIKTREGAEYFAPSVVLTTGTFLNGLIHVGQKNYIAGRQGEEASVALPTFIHKLGLEMGRLKTGTPPRLLRSSLDFSKMEKQGSDELDYLYEFEPHKVTHKLDCYITHTNEKTHAVIKENFEQSPIFTGHIKGKPPRYCPSIEDKISRFADKSSHHVFVEPESASSDEMYPNGLSTSLPMSVQLAFIRTISGFENAIITRPGYAVEYDFVLPHQLKHSLETKEINGLFMAGQINGTTGYEEAAGQGIIGGINAALKAQEKDPFIIDRTEGYIGIMIDDLVTLGVDEPYRMFTSRAERRLILRQDNVFVRLGEKAFTTGLISEEVYKKIQHEKELVSSISQHIKSRKDLPSLMRKLSEGHVDEIRQEIIQTVDETLSERVIQSVYAELLYGPYLKRELREIEKFQQYNDLNIPVDFNYQNIPGLSKELQQKLGKYKPGTIAQAALIQGMTPAAISLLIFKVREQLNQNCGSENSCDPVV
jgi:tRNA uridine 5-carboxymethylaminomethyl modification enzyme